MNKQTVEFNKATIVRDHNGDIEFKADAGEVVELEYHSAQRWIQRGRAEVVKAKKAPAKKAAKKKGRK